MPPGITSVGSSSAETKTPPDRRRILAHKKMRIGLHKCLFMSVSFPFALCLRFFAAGILFAKPSQNMIGTFFKIKNRKRQFSAFDFFGDY
jgi:hypothetical protein